MVIFNKFEVVENISKMREIRDKISEETKDMSYDDFKKYLNNQNAKDCCILSENVLSKDWSSDIEELAWLEL